MPAVVMHSVCQKSEDKPYALPRHEWLHAHALPPAVIAEAMTAVSKGDPVKPFADAHACWGDDLGALLFPSLEVATAVARLLRHPDRMEMVWTDVRVIDAQGHVGPRIGEKAEPGRITEVGTRRFVSPRRQRSTRLDSHDAIERDWHQRAVNSGGND